ncbi:MAG: FxsA family protein [Candidatus Fermentithermobacillus carboniphilus]|uniref:FxsA family protein n=1 Tax=Candidatus Fermentithermobacillus carboniphilus TaxID=3085328 RepID=A0AAT9LER9_9FIRM|nr:MAG: FxsA family protein [Candidatus Fermentithermobacillus carboniphilus]
MSFTAKLVLTGIFVFTILPIIELALLIEVGRRIGTFWTVAMVIGTGILGGILLGLEGYGVIRALKREVHQGRIPGDQIIDGVLVSIGAVLLITPGLLTDIAGVFLMFPPTRFIARALVKRWIRNYIFIDL